MQAEVIKAQALRLPPKERAELAAELLSSLDGADAAEIEKLWIEEAERRFHAYKSGQVQGIPAEQALREARSKIS